MALAERYAALLAAKQIERDPAQEQAVSRLSELEKELAGRQRARRSFWRRTFRLIDTKPARGLYIFGAVGRGKTMLMDLFFQGSVVRRKRRVHFHEFMADVHDRIHHFRTSATRRRNGEQDAVIAAADEIARRARLLCFDEFHVTDIADAMILGRLFTRLFEKGVTVVATSNAAPDDLYRDGLNRGLFLPFIDLLKDHMDVLRLEARTDFRLEKLVRGKVWHVPADREADVALDRAWSSLTSGEKARALDLIVKGRKLHVPKTAQGAARFSFNALCEQPLGAADYLRLAHEFHTVMIDRIPVMDQTHRNAAKRFITLIDTLYDNGVKLIASAQARPHALYQADDGIEAVEFQRAASRLIEMGSQSYLGLPHGRAEQKDERATIVDT